MKRLLILLFAVISLVGNAQTSNKDQRVSEIRKIYADALSGVKEQTETHTPPLANLSMKVRRIEPAVGEVTYENEVFQLLPYENYSFLRSKRTFGPYPPTYVEALYDVDGHLIFLFKKEPFVYDDKTYTLEQRLYWNTDGTLCERINKKIWDDGKVETPNEDDAVFVDLNDVKKSFEEKLKQYTPFLSVPEMDEEFE